MEKKKLLVTLAALATGLFGLYSCNSKEETPAGGELEEIQVVLTLDTPVTKTINQENKTLWAEDDKISAIGTEYGEEEYVSNYLTYRGNNTFGGRITYPGNENNWYFVYPYREENETPKQIHVTVAQEQEQTGNDNMNHIAGAGFPLIGKVIDLKRSEQIEVRMANVLVRLDYMVKNTLDNDIVVKQVVFTTPHKISGNFVGDMTSDLVNWNAEDGASNSVVLNVQEGTSIAKGETVSFHAGILPITLAEGESMKIKVVAVNPTAPNTDLVFYREITMDSKMHLYANKFYDFTLNFDAAHTTDPNPEMNEPDDPQNPDEPGDPDKQDQTLSFAQATVTLTMSSAGGTQAVQTVSGNETNPVQYSSSNPSVATINGTTLTITGFGSTVITATAPEDDNYNSGSASYTLVIQQESTTGSERTYTYQTSVSAGTYLLGGYESSNSQYSIALFPTVITGNWESSQGSVTNGQYIGQRDIDSSNTLTFSNDNEIFNAEVELIASGNNWKIKILSTGEYLTVPTQDNRITYTTSESSATAFSISAGTGTGSGYGMGTGSGSTMGISSGNYYFYHSSSAHGFSMRAYQVTNIRLYKKTSESGTSGNQNQTLTFAQSTVTQTLANASGTLSVQTVSGNKTTPVQYSSSNPDVATINGTTITITGFGSTVITATAPAGNGYNSGSASYTLVIEKQSSGGDTPTSTERTYTYQSSASAGTYLLGGYESEGSKYSIALFPTVITGNWNSSQGNVTNGQYIGQRDIDSSNTLTFNNDSEIFNAEVELIASGSNWKIKILSTGEYLTVPSQDNRITYTSSESSATAFTIGGSDTGSSWGGGNWGGTSSGNTLGIYSGSYYFYHSSSAQGYSMRAYQVTNIRLYKKTSEGGTSGGGTTGNQDQTLTFAQSTVTQTMANASGTMSVQTVSGNQTTPVQYTSSNPSVATVNGTTITITGFGSTTITATAPAGNGYNSGSASYTLIINQSSGGGSSTGERTYTYVAPGSLQEGTYIIAGSETNELSVALFPSVSTASWNSQQTGQVNNGQYVPHKVYGSSNTANTITTTDSDIIGGEVELVKNGSNWRILVKANSQYLASPSQEYRISFTSNASSAANFSISSGTNGATVQTGSYYFYHSGSAGGFTLRTNSTSNLRFYQLTSGGDSSGKQYQSLSFANGTETLALESASGTYQVQAVKGAQTTVTYSSSNTSVATVNGTTLTITGYGSTTITANAASNDYYYSASASYTLTVKKASQTGVYNLENEALTEYLDEAYNTYTANNHNNTTLIKGSSYTWGQQQSNPFYKNYVVSDTNRYDWPAPATVTWTQSVTASNCTLAVYYDQAYTNEEIMAVPQISNTSADIYNLIPGKTYYWVLKNGNTTVASGHFDTEGRRRMVGIGQKSNYGQNYANNCRDFGGQVTTSGKKIKYGRMFRGSNMDNTTAEQKKYLLEKMKIRLDVDLRTGNGNSSNNGNNTYNALASNSSNVTMNNITAGDYNTYVGHTQEQYSGGSDLTDPQKMGPTLMRIMNAIHNGVNVYIHCMVGADRTGGTCLYLESLLGVAPERCDMDFELTSFSCVGARARDGSAGTPEQYRTVYNAINNTSGDTWQQKAINYCVNTLGVSSSMITQFQNDMLE